MSEIWAPPTTAQQYPTQPSTGVDALLNRIRKIEGILAEVVKGSPLRQAGMGVSPGQVEFDGDVVISGTLSLPAGIINNDALANPLDFSADSADSSNFALSVAGAPVASKTITVPAGFTKAVVQGFGIIQAFNTTATLEYLYAKVSISWPGESNASRWLLTPLTPNNGSGSLSVNNQVEIPGLTPGQQIVVSIMASSAFAALPAAGLNEAAINCLVIWAR